MEPMEFTIEADESQATSALDRVRGKLNDVERVAISTFQKMTGAADSFARGVVKVAEVTGGIVIAKRAWDELRDSVTGADTAQQRQVLTVENLTDSYRNLRLTMAAIAGTRAFATSAGTLGVGLVIEESLRTAKQGADELNRVAGEAAKAKAEITDALAFDYARKVGRVDLSSFLGNFSATELRAYLQELRQIEDPLNRAAKAYEVFGKEGGAALALLDQPTERLIDRSLDLATALDGATRQSVDRARRDFIDLGNTFGGLGDKIRQLREEAARAITVKVSVFLEYTRTAGQRISDSTGGRGFGDPGGNEFGINSGAGGPVNIIPSLAEILADATDGGRAQRLRLPAGPGDVRGLVGADPAAQALAEEGRRATEAVRAFETTLDGLQAQLSQARRRRDNLFGLVQQGGQNAALFGGDAVSADAQVRNLQAQIEGIQKLKQAREQVAQILLAAQEAELKGLDLIEAKRLQQIKQYGTERDLIQQINQAAEIRRKIEGDAVATKLNTAFLAGLEKSRQIQDLQFAEATLREQEYQRDTEDLRNRTAKSAAEHELQIAKEGRDAQVRQLEAFGNRDLATRVAIEQRKAVVEEDYLLRTYKLKADLLDRELKLELRNMEAIARARGVSEEEIAARRDALIQASAERGKQLDDTTQAAINTARENAAIRSQQIIFDAQRKSYEDLQRRVEGAFDALLASGKTTGERLKNFLVLPAVAAFKQLAVEGTTALIAPLFGLQKQGGAVSGAGGGIFGRLLGGGGAGALGIGGLIGPGGTAGFNGSAGLPGAGGGLGSLGGLGGGLGAGKIGLGSASSLGALGLGGAALGAYGAFSAGRSGNTALRASAPAIGAVSGLVGFGALSMLFPGLIAAGPAGWIAAAGIGATIGIIGLLTKGAEQKIVDRTKAIYGITISRQFAKDPLLGLIKSQFGGNVDVALRSPQIRDLIELYAMSTAQGTGGLGINRMAPIAFAQTGGQLFRQPTFSNGSAISLDSIGGGTATNAAPSAPISLQLDAEATTAFLQGQTVQTIQQNPRMVQGAVMSANRSNAGRRENAALAIQPGALVV